MKDDATTADIFLCTACYMVIQDAEILRDNHPLRDGGIEWRCPECRGIETLIELPDCYRLPTATGAP